MHFFCVKSVTIHSAALHNTSILKVRYCERRHHRAVSCLLPFNVRVSPDYYFKSFYALLYIHFASK